MVNRPLRVNEIVESVSITHSFDKDELIAVNTSDVLEGHFLTPELLPVSELKGQFKKTIRKDDILFSEIRPANKRYARVDFENTENYVVSTKLMVLRKFNSDVDLDYFYYWLTNEENLKILQARAENRICSFPQITFELLSEYDVPTPHMHVQKKIACILKTIDEKINKNKKINKELECISNTLYHYWFLQFEFPNKVGKPYKSSGGKMIWNEKLKRAIPDEWKVEKLKDISTLSLGGTPSRDKKEYWENGTINWLNSGEISNFPIIASEEKITRLGLENSATEYMKKGTIVISITGNIRVSILGIDSCANQSVVGISESGMYMKEYLYPAISMLIDQFTKISTGNCQQHINKKTLEESKTLIPPDVILQNYYLQVKPLFTAILNNAFQNRELSTFRDFLLPLLMNSQVTFR